MKMAEARQVEKDALLHAMAELLRNDHVQAADVSVYRDGDYERSCTFCGADRSGFRHEEHATDCPLGFALARYAALYPEAPEGRDGE